MPANQSEASADALSEGNIDAPNRESVNTLLWPEQGKAAVDWGAWPGNQSRRGRADPECAQGTDSASDARKDKERGRPITLHIRLAGGAGFGRVAMDDAARQYFLKTLAHGCQRVRSEAPSARIAKRLQGHHLSYPTLGNALESSWYPGIAELVGTYPGRPWVSRVPLFAGRRMAVMFLWTPAPAHRTLARMPSISLTVGLRRFMPLMLRLT